MLVAKSPRPRASSSSCWVSSEVGRRGRRRESQLHSDSRANTPISCAPPRPSSRIYIVDSSHPQFRTVSKLVKEEKENTVKALSKLLGSKL